MSPWDVLNVTYKLEFSRWVWTSQLPSIQTILHGLEYVLHAIFENILLLFLGILAVQEGAPTTVSFWYYKKWAERIKGLLNKMTQLLTQHETRTSSKVSVLNSPDAHNHHYELPSFLWSPEYVIHFMFLRQMLLGIRNVQKFALLAFMTSVLFYLRAMDMAESLYLNKARMQHSNQDCLPHVHPWVASCPRQKSWKLPSVPLPQTLPASTEEAQLCQYLILWQNWPQTSPHSTIRSVHVDWIHYYGIPLSFP